MFNKLFYFDISNTAIQVLLLTLIVTPTVRSQDYIVPPMINIPAGEFMMGTQGGDNSAKPIHKVSVDAFQMGKYTVTVAEFRKFALDTGFNPASTCNDFIDNEGLRGPTYQGTGRWDKHRFSYSDYQPVTCISWQDANAYAKWLSDKTGIQYRLPTEQEWEYAAKGNTTSRYFWGNDVNMTQACQYGNFGDQTGEYFNSKDYFSTVGFIGYANCEDSEVYDAIVGLYRPNPFGLYDIAGNVSQFMDSCYHENGYKIGLQDERDTNQCEYIVHRGGTWHYPPSPHFDRGRFKREGWNVGASMGFRLAIDGHKNAADASTFAFEAALQKAQQDHLEARVKLPKSPQNIQLVNIKENTFKLSWQPSDNDDVTGYEIYRSNSAYAHLYGGFYQKHYDKINTVGATDNSMNVTLAEVGGSFRVVTVGEKVNSLPSQAALTFEPKTMAIPGRIAMQNTIKLENVYLGRSKAKDDIAESYYIYKTNKEFDQDLVTSTFNVDVKKSAWYYLNYRGRSFHAGEFFKLWQNNTLLGVITYDPNIDDKTSNRHKVFLEKGSYAIQLTVLREGFDMWSLSWLEFNEMKD